MFSQPLSNVQEELLKLYSTDLSEKELQELKTILGKFYAKKAIKTADDIWENNEYSDEKVDKWLNEE